MCSDELHVILALPGAVDIASSEVNVKRRLFQCLHCRCFEIVKKKCRCSQVTVYSVVDLINVWSVTSWAQTDEWSQLFVGLLKSGGYRKWYSHIVL